MLFWWQFLANFNVLPTFCALNAVKKNEIKKDMMKWTKNKIKKRYDEIWAKENTKRWPSLGVKVSWAQSLPRLLKPVYKDT